MRGKRELVKARVEGFGGFWGFDLRSGAYKGGTCQSTHTSKCSSDKVPLVLLLA